MTKSQQKRIYRAALALRRMQDLNMDAMRRKTTFKEDQARCEAATEVARAGFALTDDDLAELERVLSAG